MSFSALKAFNNKLSDTATIFAGVATLINVSNTTGAPFAGFISSSNRISKPNTTLYLSVLIKKNNTYKDMFYALYFILNKQKDETRTTNLNSLFCVIASLQSITVDKNKRLQGNFALKSLSVERKGKISTTFIENLDRVCFFLQTERRLILL